MPADRSDAACTVAGVRKPSMNEPASAGGAGGPVGNVNRPLYLDCRARLRHVANEAFDSRAVKANRSRFHDPMSRTVAFVFHDIHLSGTLKGPRHGSMTYPICRNAQFESSARPTHSRVAGLLASGNGSLCGLVDVLEFQFGLLPGSFQDPDGVGDILFRVVSHDLHPDARGPLRDGREFNQIGDQSEFRQSLADQTSQAFRSHLYADDCGRIAVVIEASRTQLLTKTQNVCHQCQTLHASFYGIDDVERFQDSGRLDRRQRVGECRGRTVEAKIFLHGAALASDEAAI